MAPHERNSHKVGFKAETILQRTRVAKDIQVNSTKISKMNDPISPALVSGSENASGPIKTSEQGSRKRIS